MSTPEELARQTIERMLENAGAKRVLFLVDRANLGRQALKEFQQYATPDDGRKFTELYNVQHLAGGGVHPAELMGQSDLSQVMKYALSDEKRARAGVTKL